MLENLVYWFDLWGSLCLDVAIIVVFPIFVLFVYDLYTGRMVIQVNREVHTRIEKEKDADD